MKIKILGSGGGEGFPAMFCGCEHCNAARKAGGKSIRSLSQAIINDDLLIDFPTDTNMHALAHSLNLGNVENILVTHNHSDHFVPVVLDERGGLNAHKMKFEKVGIVGSKEVIDLFEKVFSVYDIEKEYLDNIKLTNMNAEQTKVLGKYKVTALKASHSENTGPLNYIIDDGERCLLYLLDTGYPTGDTLDFIQRYYKQMDCVIMDATMGILPERKYRYHMSFGDNKLLKEELLSRKIANDKTRFIISHITHNQAETHDKIEEIFIGTGIEVAFDGMNIDL